MAGQQEHHMLAVLGHLVQPKPAPPSLVCRAPEPVLKQPAQSLARLEELCEMYVDPSLVAPRPWRGLKPMVVLPRAGATERIAALRPPSLVPARAGAMERIRELKAPPKAFAAGLRRPSFIQPCPTPLVFCGGSLVPRPPMGPPPSKKAKGEDVEFELKASASAAATVVEDVEVKASASAAATVVEDVNVKEEKAKAKLEELEPEEQEEFEEILLELEPEPGSPESPPDSRLRKIRRWSSRRRNKKSGWTGWKKNKKSGWSGRWADGWTART